MMLRSPSARGRRYGWKPDLPNAHYPRFAAPARLVAALPPSADLRATMPPVYDQGDLGSCTYNAIGGALHYNEIQQTLAKVVQPSRLFGYYLERLVEGTVDSDAGAAISDGIAITSQYGFCDEALWPYDIAKFRSRPPQNCFDDAAPRKISDYGKVTQTLDQIRAVIAGGDPVVFGFTVFESFESDAVAKTGLMPIPKRSEQVLGGHAVLACGYDDSRQVALCRNSWGAGWGLGGYFLMPYAYIVSKYASDFWVVRSVPGTPAPPPPPPPGPPTPPPPPATRSISLTVTGDAVKVTATGYVVTVAAAPDPDAPIDLDTTPAFPGGVC